LRNIIYEFYVLTENFMEAFLQVKSLDKVFRENGDRVYDFGITMRNNKDYKLSNKAMDYVIENHPQSAYFFKALTAKSVNSELIAFETIPLDTNALRESVNAYQELLQNFGREPRFFDAIYRKANLSAFYLHDLTGALKELEDILPRGLEPQQKAEANLLMGDIFLMQKEYNKAKLKYSEVAEAYKDGQIGALAKFKEGRMSYFKGDFEIAKARLKTIKDNTSNDISNDAIKLFLLIQDNSGLDTTEVPLQRFAQAQLQVFQLDYDPALASLDSLLFDFPNHSLTDEIYWEKANIYLQKGDLTQGLAFLDRIITAYPEDIWGDDALYTKAKIYDYTLKDAEKARQLYTEFLFKYEGSLYIVNVRKRLREMRNDRL
jgi:tetratricopeptide (TPR) repeat protein